MPEVSSLGRSDLTRVFLTLDAQQDRRKAFADRKAPLCKEASNLDCFGKSSVGQNSRPLSASYIATR